MANANKSISPKNSKAATQGIPYPYDQLTKSELVDLLSSKTRFIYCTFKNFVYICSAKEPYYTVYKVHKSPWAYLRCASTPCSCGSFAGIGGTPSFYAIN